MPGDLLIRVALLLVVAVAAAVVLARERDPEEHGSATSFAVARVVDGDTIDLANGDVVRLVQIDAPELGEGECYARASRAELERLLAGRRVRLEFDPRVHAADADRADRFGRLLAYVFRGRENVNVALVRRGAAAPWFFDGVRGRYASELLRAARRARAEGAGFWRACAGTRLQPLAGLETQRP